MNVVKYIKRVKNIKIMIKKYFTDEHLKFELQYSHSNVLDLSE